MRFQSNPFLFKSKYDSVVLCIRAGATNGLEGAVVVRGNWKGSSNAGGYTTFLTDGSERMRISETGNVLISTTTNGSYKLDVNGPSRIGSTTTSGLTIWNGTVVDNDEVTYSEKMRINITNTTSGTLTFSIKSVCDPYDSGTRRFRMSYKQMVCFIVFCRNFV